MLSPAKLEVRRWADRQIKALEFKKKKLEMLRRANEKANGFVLPEITVCVGDAAESVIGSIDYIMDKVGNCLVLELMAEDIFACQGLDEILDYACSKSSITYVRLVTKEGQAPSQLQCYMMKNNFVEVHVYQETGNPNSPLVGLLKAYDIEAKNVLPEISMERASNVEDINKYVLKSGKIVRCSQNEVWQVLAGKTIVKGTQKESTAIDNLLDSLVLMD